MPNKFDYNSLLFRELRMIALEPSKQITDEAITKAITLNENLKALGYCFTPNDFALICRSNIDTLFDEIKSYVGEVKAEPMYKGFPEEVMAMDEATFRFHQILHYMTTYGIEEFTGASVSKGWLPESSEQTRDKTDTFSTELKILEIIEEKSKYFTGAKTVLSRKTRLTNSQVELVKESVKHLDIDQLNSLEIPFKENIQVIFDLGMEEKELVFLKIACKNPMDAFKCTEQLLSENNWHLRTSQKRLVAKLMDTFDNNSFEENMIYSASRREKVIHILDQIDYPSYSRNEAHKKSFNDLKDKKLKSWMSKVEKYIFNDDAENLFRTLKERPGMFLRMCVRLIRFGYSKEVKENLLEVADKLSIQTILDIMNAYSQNKPIYKKDCESEKLRDWDIFMKILKPVLAKRLSGIDTAIKGKKVYLDKQDYDLAHSMIMKSDEGGYNRGGLAFKLPEDLKKVRFFVYWNHPSRVDVDLHADCFRKDKTYVPIGWNGSFKDDGVVFSGDITHSDAAEYVDIDLENSDTRYIYARINLYYGDNADTFSEIDTCFAGLMGVNNLNQDVKLYDPKACYISHELTSKSPTVEYGLINFENKYIQYFGKAPSNGLYYAPEDFKNPVIPELSLENYLETLFTEQNVEVVKTKEEADLVLSMAKGGDVSMIDENFWVDC